MATTLMASRPLTGTALASVARQAVRQPQASQGPQLFQIRAGVRRSTFLSDTASLKTQFQSVSSSARSSGRPLLVQSKYLGNSAASTKNRAQNAAHETAGRVSDAVTGSQGEVNAGAVSLILAVALPVVLGAFIRNSSQPSSEWYKGLNKPSWNPPDWMFGLAWSILYAIIGYSGWLVWQVGGWDAQQGPLVTFAFQLALNFAWPVIAFGGKNLGLALADIVVLFFAIIATIQAFKPVNTFAANLLYPYLAWVAFAAALNYNLWRNNRGTPPGASYSGTAYST